MCCAEQEHHSNSRTTTTARETHLSRVSEVVCPCLTLEMQTAKAGKVHRVAAFSLASGLCIAKPVF